MDANDGDRTGTGVNAASTRAATKAQGVTFSVPESLVDSHLNIRIAEKGSCHLFRFGYPGGPGALPQLSIQTTMLYTNTVKTYQGTIIIPGINSGMLDSLDAEFSIPKPPSTIDTAVKKEKLGEYEKKWSINFIVAKEWGSKIADGEDIEGKILIIIGEQPKKGQKPE